MRPFATTPSAAVASVRYCTRSANEGERMTKRPYAKPQLRRLGLLRRLTKYTF